MERQFHLVPASKQPAVTVWHTPDSVCTVLDSRWWTERPSVTCRVLFQNKINLRYCASGWFYWRMIQYLRNARYCLLSDAMLRQRTREFWSTVTWQCWYPLILLEDKCIDTHAFTVKIAAVFSKFWHRVVWYVGTVVTEKHSNSHSCYPEAIRPASDVSLNNPRYERPHVYTEQCGYIDLL
jgi:hypothetical protein